uniref:Uncharacterized protein n=1 Tax=Panagrolaimus sp. JU765 TaxID=591449 RepID=A0AC34QPH6_9BILA
MVRYVNHIIGQRIICYSKKYPNKATIWRFYKRSENFDEFNVLIYRCSLCQADYNEVLRYFQSNIIIPEIKVRDDGELIDDPEYCNHFCQWETSEGTELGLLHAERLLFLSIQDMLQPITQAAVSKKLHELKKNPIFDHLNSEQKEKAMNFLNQIDREKVIEWLNATKNSLETSPLHCEQTFDDISPPLSRWRSTISLVSPQRIRTMRTIFTGMFRSSK